MEKKSREELNRIRVALHNNTLSARETYHAIQLFGEMNFQEARPEVEQYLTSDNPELRFVALKVLTRYWHLQEHWETARKVLLCDADEDCRFRAADALADLKCNTQDQQTLKVLARVVRNEQEKAVVRISAFAGMKAVLHFDPREQFDIVKGGLDVEKKVDWKVVDAYLS